MHHPSSQAGLFIDKGVKTTNASAADPREYLCLDNSARYVSPFKTEINFWTEKCITCSVWRDTQLSDKLFLKSVVWCCEWYVFTANKYAAHVFA